MATANHKMIPEHYPYQVGFEWEPPYRFERIRSFIESAHHEQHKLTVADMEALQNDVVSLPARELQTLLRSTALRDNPALAEFLRWDGRLTRESREAALYEVWLKEICRSLGKRFSEKHGERYENLLPDTVAALLKDPEKDLFGEVPVTARDTLLLDALEAARKELGQRRGRIRRTGPGAIFTRYASVTRSTSSPERASCSTWDRCRGPATSIR